jgi:hypothetical protein
MTLMICFRNIYRFRLNTTSLYTKLWWIIKSKLIS